MLGKSEDRKNKGILIAVMVTCYLIMSGSVSMAGNTNVGCLDLSIYPRDAVEKGARFCITVENERHCVTPDRMMCHLPVGIYKISFTKVKGYIKPGTGHVQIKKGKTTTTAYRYK